MIQSLSYGAANPSIAMRQLGMRYDTRPIEDPPVQLGACWNIIINKEASPSRIKASLFKLALEQSEEGHEAFSDELLTLAASYE